MEGILKQYIKGANPYMPLWEHVPDGEPRVFEYKGEKRVYVYGSHDTERNQYCGRDYVVWSAPCTDLTDWRCDGVAFETYRDILYAPDVVKKGDTYYMYIAMHKGMEIWVAESKSPAGPFENPRKTDFGFDIGVLVDDDGRCYAYWGFKKCYAAEINDDMATIKEGTLVTNMIPHCGYRDNLWDTENIDDEFSYFEAASIRKVFGKYVFIYSKRDMKGDPEQGRDPSCNAYLDYAYSDSPLSGWVHGGTLIANTGEVITNWDGKKYRAYKKSNNHGSIAEINGQWYVFYHRGTGSGSDYARQAMLEPIEAAMGKNGELYLGRIKYDRFGDPCGCTEVEMTSQGAHVNGLNAYDIISAGYACYIDPSYGNDPVYIKPVYDKNNPSAPVVGLRMRSTVGFKYIDFGDEPPTHMFVRIKGSRATMRVCTGSADNLDSIVEVYTPETGDFKWVGARMMFDVTGKQKLFFEIVSYGECEFDAFTFTRYKDMPGDWPSYGRPF